MVWQRTAVTPPVAGSLRIGHGSGMDYASASRPHETTAVHPAPDAAFCPYRPRPDAQGSGSSPTALPRPQLSVVPSLTQGGPDAFNVASLPLVALLTMHRGVLGMADDPEQALEPERSSEGSMDAMHNPPAPIRGVRRKKMTELNGRRLPRSRQQSSNRRKVQHRGLLRQ